MSAGGVRDIEVEEHDVLHILRRIDERLERIERIVCEILGTAPPTYQPNIGATVTPVEPLL